MINSDRIHVAMTKTCGPVATLACQSNTFKQTKKQITLPSLCLSVSLAPTRQLAHCCLLHCYPSLTHAHHVVNDQRCPTAYMLLIRSSSTARSTCTSTDYALFFIFVFNKDVALAVKCHHSSAHFRHRNVYLIRVDHLPLGKL